MPAVVPWHWVPAGGEGREKKGRGRGRGRGVLLHVCSVQDLWTTPAQHQDRHKQGLQ